MSNKTLELVREELKNKSIPLDELLSFKNEIENQIKILQDDMIKQFREMALANGIELEFLADKLIKSREATTPNKLPPKYKNSNNQTWNGHGRKPKWITEWIDAGNKLDDLLIEKNNL